MEKLNILWTSNDKDTFMMMVSMYSMNALKSGWFDEVNVVIWGGSTRLSSEDAEVQTKLIEMIEKGITIEACKACADKLNASEVLKGLGVEVKYMSKLTKYIKGDDHLITV